MHIRIVKFGILAALILSTSAEASKACGRRNTVICCNPCWPCPPCYPCCPPDVTPLYPVPTHPVPHSTTANKLTLQNKSYSEAFVIIYIRHWDGIYRAYEKKFIGADSSPLASQPNGYFEGDSLLIEIWTRGTPTDFWHCHCPRLILLTGASGAFDVINGHYTSP
jgi:hypothetical protein